MRLRMWTYDIAREQCPTHEYLDGLCKLSLESGYNALGLYLEHRFAYPSTPWVHGKHILTPEIIQALQKEYKELQLVPFINLLGHFEGFIYTEKGSPYACERFTGMQADPTNEGFKKLCHQLIDDTVSIFNSELIHIGGDETQQLGKGAASEAKVKEFEASGIEDGKAELYGKHFGEMAEKVIELGRVPGVWGDMFFEHPTALQHLPKETIVFDWQYFHSPELTSRQFLDAGYKTVFCPTIFTYSATWCHLPQSERNIVEHAVAAETMGAEGVCVTTWECGLMGNYNTLLPAIEGAGHILSNPPETIDFAKTKEESYELYKGLRDAPILLKSYLKAGEPREDWARIMGCELQEVGGFWEFTGIRSSLKSRLLMYSNPFLLWLRNREGLAKPGADEALLVAKKAMAFAMSSDERGVCQFVEKAIEFVHFAELAHQAYADGKPGEAITYLSPCRQIFEELEKVAVASHINSCGSLADIERCKRAKKHVEEVILRVKAYGAGALGYLPSFETLTHPKFMPHDQANWWLINSWANE
ncbi:MAG TPA: family 20 glycosylhydrolase [Fimbriimonas sp.]|nr:family 20 glycosylhydrolase [Fimbriimonas sp.]